MYKKTIVLVMALSLVYLTSAVAAQNGAGCGLGGMVLEGESGLLMNTIAQTLNGTGSQTFGMTSGTSGCDTDQVVKSDKEQEVFVAVNLETISEEMAQGNGEHLNALATLMGCSTSVHGEFAGLTQEKYNVLFAGAETSTPELLSGLKREMIAHPALSAACTRIS